MAKHTKLPGKWRGWGSPSWELAKRDGQGLGDSDWHLGKQCSTRVWQTMMCHILFVCRRKVLHWSHEVNKGTCGEGTMNDQRLIELVMCNIVLTSCHLWAVLQNNQHFFKHLNNSESVFSCISSKGIPQNVAGDVLVWVGLQSLTIFQTKIHMNFNTNTDQRHKLTIFWWKSDLQ